MKPLTMDKYGFVNFMIQVEEDVEYSMKFQVYEVTCWGGDDDKTPIDIEPRVRGIIKWDGCSQVYFGEDEGGYLHLCGKSSWDDHCKMMEALWDLAAKTITKFNKSVAE